MANVTWTKGSSSTWNTAANWSGGSVPAVGDDVIIDTTTALFVTLNTTTGSLASLTLTKATGAVLTASGTQTLNVNNSTASVLTIAGGSMDFGTGALTVNASNLTVTGGSMAILDADARLAVFKSGGSNTVTLSGGEIQHTLGQFNIGLEFGTSGVMTIATGGTLAMSGGILATPTVTVAGGVFDNSGGTTTTSAINQFSGTLAMSGTARINASGASQFNSGVLSLAGSAILDQVGAFASNGATISLSGSSRIESDATFNLNTGVVTMSGTSSIKGATGIGNNGTITGAGTIEGSITGGGGTFIADGGVMTLTGTTTSFNNVYRISNNDSSTLQFTNKVGTNDITFAGALGTLAIGDIANFKGTVVNLRDTVKGNDGNADTGVLRIVGKSIDSGTIVSSNTIRLVDAGSTFDVKFSGGVFIDGPIAVGLKADGGDTIVWVDDVVCYAAGTAIETAHGSRPIETLRPGDTVMAVVDGERVPRPIKWVGHRHVDLVNHRNRRAVAPIRIRAGALGDGVPARDLLVSPPHAIALDGHLIEAWRLVNGVSIVRDLDLRSVDYYHIELDQHALILAEGAAAETYLDDGNRDFFTNAPVTMLADPVYRRTERDAAATCLPLLTDRDAIAPYWVRLVQRSAPMMAARSVEADLHLWLDGRRIDPVEVVGTRRRFLVPRSATTPRLRSSTVAPIDHAGIIGDERLLGVPVWRVVVRLGETVRELSLDDPAFAQGWHGVERDDAHVYRWTNGDALLPISAGGEAFILDIETGEPAAPAAIIAARLAA